VGACRRTAGSLGETAFGSSSREDVGAAGGVADRLRFDGRRGRGRDGVGDARRPGVRKAAWERAARRSAASIWPAGADTEPLGVAVSPEGTRCTWRRATGLSTSSSPRTVR